MAWFCDFEWDMWNYLAKQNYSWCRVSKNQPGNKMWNCVKPAQIAGIYFGYIQLTNTFACFWMIRLLISTYCIRYWHGEFHGILFFFHGFSTAVVDSQRLPVYKSLNGFIWLLGGLWYTVVFDVFGVSGWLSFCTLLYLIYTRTQKLCVFLVNQLYV